MVKQSIARHEDSYKNWSIYIKKEREQLENKIARIKIEEDRLCFYRQQIDTAKEKQMDGFDSERFLHKRSKQNG